MSKRLVDTNRVRQQRSQSLVESVTIASIFPPYSSDTESETSSASNESSPSQSPPRFSCSIDTIFPPARSPSQSPPRFSFSLETFFPPARSPSQSPPRFSLSIETFFLPAMDGLLTMQEEEEEEEEDGFGLLSTEELNKRCDDFIRKMKEEIKFAAKQLIIV